MNSRDHLRNSQAVRGSLCTTSLAHLVAKRTFHPSRRHSSWALEQALVVAAAVQLALRRVLVPFPDPLKRSAPRVLGARRLEHEDYFRINSRRYFKNPHTGRDPQVILMYLARCGGGRNERRQRSVKTRRAVVELGAAVKDAARHKAARRAWCFVAAALYIYIGGFTAE